MIYPVTLAEARGADRRSRIVRHTGSWVHHECTCASAPATPTRPITDFDTWSSAFDRFANVRRSAGVRAERVQLLADNSRHVVIDLDFATISEAAAFLGFLSNQVWSTRESSPALAGTPQMMILEDAAKPTNPER